MQIIIIPMMSLIVNRGLNGILSMLFGNPMGLEDPVLWRK